ncbi:hypothetical protein [Thiosulfatimonas sediminis]|uniref:hypothetical protein n=1 Tax=Thiosulfatimonas sediminis TaxID=2675054 RepID=UPI001566071A|nr:hypothetical protein [Thiosulfatimonas sediminis]
MLIAPNVKAAEYYFGVGTSHIEGGLLGLEKGLSSESTTFTMKNSHTSLLESRFFYDYSISYAFPSEELSLQTSQLSSDGGAANFPTTQFKLNMFDAQATLGYDIRRWGERDYIGMGMSLGIAFPTIENAGSSANGSEIQNYFSAPVPIANGDAVDVNLVASKTEFSGYRLGPKFNFMRSWNDRAAWYGEISYAPQTVKVKNETFGTSLEVDGDFLFMNLGSRYLLWNRQPQKLGLFTVGPKAFMDIGFTHSQLRLDKFSLDLSGNNYQFVESHFIFRNTAFYVGLVVTLF